MDINIIINSKFIQKTDKETLFGDEDVIIIESADMQTLHVELGLFSSKGQAIKAGRKGDIPLGWNTLKGNKKTFLFIWNPTC